MMAYQVVCGLKLENSFFSPASTSLANNLEDRLNSSSESIFMEIISLFKTGLVTVTC